MKKTLTLGVGALAGVLAAPYVLGFTGIAPTAGVGLDDVITAACVVAGIMATHALIG